MKLLIPLVALLVLTALPGFARTYAFTLADPDPKAEAAIRQLYDSGQLKSAPGSAPTLVAIWLKAADDEPLYLFVSPHGVCDKAKCWIMGFRLKGDNWTKIYDQPVTEDIDIGITPDQTGGHHDIVQVEEAGDKRIELISSWTGEDYGKPRRREEPLPKD